MKDDIGGLVCVFSTIIMCFLWLIYRRREENFNFRQGKDALNRSDLDLTLSCANEEIKRDKKHPRGYWLRGQALHRKGMYREAIKDYNQAIRLAPQEWGSYRLRGESNAALGLYDQAIADYSDALRLNPTDTVAIERRKVAYAARETRGDASPDDLPDECGIVTELPVTREEDPSAHRDPWVSFRKFFMEEDVTRNEDPSANCDNYQPSHPIQRPAASIAISSSKVFNPLAMTGFVLGLVSVVFYAIGILPILGIVFSAIGLGRFNPETQKAKWMAGWGLALSILFTFMYLTRR